MELKEAVHQLRVEKNLTGENLECVIAAAESLLAGVPWKVEHHAGDNFIDSGFIPGNPLKLVGDQIVDVLIVRLPSTK